MGSPWDLHFPGPETRVFQDNCIADLRSSDNVRVCFSAALHPVTLFHCSGERAERELAGYVVNPLQVLGSVSWRL